ncbi:MAG: Gfo/Idh/MocA family oxidoreductase, partial [Phycisphaeraceae bacterium]
MPHRSSRRTFLKHVTFAGLTMPFVAPSLVRAASPNGMVRHATIGGQGMAWSDINSLDTHEHIKFIAACDVDVNRLGAVKEKFSGLRTYADYRELLEKEDKNIDSLNVTTPDHMHAPIALAAIRQGKHVYVQKPLAHTVQEARALATAAAKHNVISQMGIQIHSRMEYRLAAEFIKAGAIGKVKRVHTWSNKNWGGGERPSNADPVPDNLNWDLWLGVAPERPFADGRYHPGQWRRWQDFGTGTFGDMGCHIYDPVYNCLELTAPVRVRSEGAEPFAETWPTSAIVHYTYPGTAQTAGDTIDVTWYDGGEMPPADAMEALGDQRPPAQGSLFIGEKGSMLLPHIGAPQLLPRELARTIERPQLPPANHYHQFIDAV